MSGASATCTIPVSGMTCAACSGRVQRSLERAAGVSSATVNLMTGEATVAFDPHATGPDQLVQVIRDTGYGAELSAPTTNAEDALESLERERAAEVRTLKWKLWVALVPAGILMLLGHPHTAGARWLALALTLPVVGWSGRHFYSRAWAALRHGGADMNTLIAVGTGAAFGFSFF
ncbi:MAG TPA: cation transporter, partial [Gemmatimonadales bacterium]|nr:cation transporter [Gemmatimonadales bacterium]